MERTGIERTTTTGARLLNSFWKLADSELVSQLAWLKTHCCKRSTCYVGCFFCASSIRV
jgi:hypothetical protein